MYRYLTCRLSLFIYYPLDSDNGSTNGLFSVEVFKRDIVPQVVHLFGVHDATVRGILLTYLPYYVSLIPKDVLAEEVVSIMNRVLHF